MVLRCTRKLLAIIGPTHTTQPPPPPSPEDWYANLLGIDGRKNLLLTHTATLFTIFQPDVRATELRSTHELLCALIDRELTNEQLPTHTFGEIHTQPLLLATTADRSILGAMNDMANACQHTIHHQGGLAHTDIPALNQMLRRNITSTSDYQPPIELTIQRVRARR